MINNPLDLSEIRVAVAIFLSNRDALACSLVCRAWSRDFTSNIWHTVDFAKHRSFEHLDPAIIAKNGQHIRVVESLSRDNEIGALQDPSITNLKSIDVRVPLGSALRLYTVDLIRRNRGALKNLEIEGNSGSEALTDFNFVDALIPKTTSSSSRLSRLALWDLCMTRDSFSVLLSACPLLRDIYLSNCNFLENRNPDAFQSAQNSHVTRLCASIRQVLEPHPGRSTQSLLVHFPGLKRWDASSSTLTLSDDAAESIYRDLRDYCPEIVSIGTYSCSGPIVQKLIAAASNSLTDVRFNYEAITPGVIGSLLYHKSTLLGIGSYDPSVDYWDYESDYVINLPDHFSSTGLGWMIQLIPMACFSLKILILPLHTMDMDVVERIPWICHGLRVLKIRVKDLDTEEDIEDVCEKWQFAQREKMRNNPLAWHSAINIAPATSVKYRVVMHLLQHSQLCSLWLGYKTWNV
ncbi:hypothetical protein BGX27_010665 [Mortierella sp. AM989]|nr:hypothetical protein BGX27_010665 [Mortierella sp. AM989]